MVHQAIPRDFHQGKVRAMVCLPKGLVQEEVWPTLLNNLITLKEAIVSTQIYSVDTKAIHQLLENTVHGVPPVRRSGSSKKSATWAVASRT